MKTVRLLPLLAVAAVCLFALKITGLMIGEGSMLSGAAPAGAQSQASGTREKPQTANEAAPPASADAAPAEKSAPPAPEQAQSADPASPGAKAEAGAEAAKPAGPGAVDAAPEEVMASGPRGAEKEILESLAERRKQLDQRARELQLRENLLKVAENRVETRIQELKTIEQRIESELKKQDDERESEYAKLVSLYSKMKPKDAARIFDRMDLTVLTGLVRKMNARTVSPILAAMDPAMAQRVTMEIASDSEGPTSSLQSLPKISGENPG